MTTWTCWRDPSHTTKAHPRWGWPQCQDCGAAPPYHERAEYLPSENADLVIFVPVDDHWGIAAGSALVGYIHDDEDATERRATISYEGWVHGSQYESRDARGRWEAGLLHAASRLVTGYPTSAMYSPSMSRVKAIGLYNAKTHTIILNDEEALDAWLK